MIMGADVNHPAAGNISKPSIAAVTASMDRFAARHAAKMRAQSHRKEIIVELATMTQELLIKFYQSTKSKPARIVFYRDGVGETQFQEVAQKEVQAIRKACNDIEPGYNPKLTFVVVQKRHHTRFFVKNRDDGDRSGNIPAGTVVDTGVCHPREYDFYLCSHAGIQGTSKPTYYRVLLDENRMRPDELYQLTFWLCHNYAACTRSVSVVPAAFYAHQMAFRGAFFVPDDSQSETASTITDEDAEPSWKQTFAQPHPNVENVMYFI
eukprot:CAMPEP_0113935646 /NCGR_PEP_ID=MMETSP1339-20121228/2767_1 /TAXON_ID=94617 /ORGANISM="Fibrocapsa japonica" /LENGTH=264 /DNA_ID=CAMNT_0000937873 /DNA_START=40 /DNA_END=834 /DNA_ORIENTATION=- /assembly_acc=CAM_ASM_000762